MVRHMFHSGFENYFYGYACDDFSDYVYDDFGDQQLGGYIYIYNNNLISYVSSYVTISVIGSRDET